MIFGMLLGFKKISMRFSERAYTNTWDNNIDNKITEITLDTPIH